MSKAIPAIHVAKRDLGLDEDTYRTMLFTVVGKASLRDMTPGEHQRVLTHMRSNSAPSGRGKLAGPYAGKLQALWISGWHLGVVRNKSDEALIAFVKGRTGIDHTRFLRNAGDARKAVEALKGMLEREASVDWSADAEPARCVVLAQGHVLGIEHEALSAMMAAATGDDGSLNGLMAKLGYCIRAKAD